MCFYYRVKLTYPHRFCSTTDKCLNPLIAGGKQPLLNNNILDLIQTHKS